eukprot:scaffold129858_cov27-Tisochrysis_lutea.AAC.1
MGCLAGTASEGIPSGVGVMADSKSWLEVAMAELSFWKMASMSSNEAGAVAGLLILIVGSSAEVP